MALAERINELRLARGLTNGQLAVLAGVDPAQITRWQTGRYVPSTGTIRKLAAALEVSVDMLLRESTEPAEDPHAKAVASVRKLARTLGVSADELRDEQAVEIVAAAVADDEDSRCMVVRSGSRCRLRRHGATVEHAFDVAV